MLKLPTPSSQQQQHSDQLKALIQSNIKTAGGLISFGNYMQQALYTPELGYYNSPYISFGTSGDFTTAPEISNLFARVIARQIAPTLSRIKNADILEFGAGSGKLAAGILSELKDLKRLPHTYYILETSKHLQARQYSTLKKLIPELMHIVSWLDHLPENLSAVVLANEVMDAMPVERFIIKDGQFHQLLVNQDLDWQIGPKIKLDLPEPANNYPDAYVSEYTNLPGEWLKSIVKMLNQGLILLFDYGYEDFEYYHPSRNTGTLKCFYQHHSHENPFLYPGLNDISAHVNFSQVAKNLNVCGFMYQSEFLIYGGITKLIADTDSTLERAKVSREIQLLTAPSQMGETVKVMAICKNIDPPEFS